VTRGGIRKIQALHMIQNNVNILTSLLFILLATFANLAWGQENDLEKKVVSAMDAAFKNWLSINDVRDGAFVVMRDDRAIGMFAYGERTVDLPVAVASLTKAITGACIAHLVDSDRLQLQDKLVDILKKEFEPLGRPQDLRINQITISDLLRNRSGLSASVDYTQNGISQFLKRYSRHKKNYQPQIDQIMRFDLTADPGSTYHYANINWLLLGLVIEQASGEPYENFCYEAVLKPLNLPISGLNPDWEMMSSYGGWRISAVDYAKFASKLVGSVRSRDGPVNRWLLKLSNEAGGIGKSFYALGTNIRFTANGRILWHSGHWNLKTSAVDGFVDVSFGAYFASFDNGYTYVANYSKGVQGKALVDLDRVMWNAIKGSAH